VSSAAAVARAIRDRRTFILTSHARPDGDAVGSCMALAFALDALGRQSTVVLRDPVPESYRAFPGIDRIVIADAVRAPADAVILLECSEIGRPGLGGLESYFTINVDHHLGNTNYGDVNWFDASAAACCELVAALVDTLDVAWTPDLAAHLYLGIATDTGGFRYGPITAGTFDICRRIADTGVDTAGLSRQIFDSFSIGRVKLTGAMLGSMELHHGDRLAILAFDDDLLRACGATADDTEGLVNLPLAARGVSAVALFKRQDAATFRLSLRSKGSVDVQSVAALWHGGGHRNAAGCTVSGDYAQIKDTLISAMARAIDVAGAPDR
jgi:phosphoesterase RecJ-like protein